MTKTQVLFAAATLSALTLAGCATDPPHSVADQQALRQDAQASLQKMYDRDPSLRDVAENANGYAIFPSVGKGGLIVGGATGRGEVYEQGKFIGFADITQATVGLQAGGQSF